MHVYAVLVGAAGVYSGLRCGAGSGVGERSGTCILGWFVFCRRPCTADMEVQFFCMPCDEMICALVGYGPATYISFYLFVRISPFRITVVSSSLTI